MSNHLCCQPAVCVLIRVAAFLSLPGRVGECLYDTLYFRNVCFGCIQSLLLNICFKYNAVPVNMIFQSDMPFCPLQKIKLL